MFDACGFKWWSDVDPERFAQQLAAWRMAGPLTKTGKARKSISPQTYNFYLGVCQQLGRWMKSPARRTEADQYEVVSRRGRGDRQSRNGPECPAGAPMTIQISG